MNIKKNVYATIALATLTLVAVSPVFAETTTQNNNQGNTGNGMMQRNKSGNRGMMRPVVRGTVSAISGNTITVSGKQGFGTTVTTVTYTVDATNAKITKNNTTGTISSIIVGDTIMVQGTVTGTNVVATTIRDGIANGINKNNGTQNNLPSITGNGLPVVAGTITSISGSTFVITNKSNVSYTIDATNAKIAQGPNTITVSNMAVGDMVVVQGTVNGNNIIASSVNDQKVTSTTGTTTEKVNKGFFSRIGSFFGSMFGF